MDGDGGRVDGFGGDGVVVWLVNGRRTDDDGGDGVTGTCIMKRERIADGKELKTEMGVVMGGSGSVNSSEGVDKLSMCLFGVDGEDGWRSDGDSMVVRRGGEKLDWLWGRLECFFLLIILVVVEAMVAGLGGSSKWSRTYL